MWSFESINHFPIKFEHKIDILPSLIYAQNKRAIENINFLMASNHFLKSEEKFLQALIDIIVFAYWLKWFILDNFHYQLIEEAFGICCFYWIFNHFLQFHRSAYFYNKMGRIFLMSSLSKLFISGLAYNSFFGVSVIFQHLFSL